MTKPMYGFHDFRRGFATQIAGSLGAEELQRMMRHESYETTKRYIQMARDLAPLVSKLAVPPILNTPRSAEG